MIESLHRIIPAERVRTRLIDRVSFASDAGFYYLVPKAVVIAASEQEIANLFAFSHQQKIPLVFRAGGTSLSGQSITDGILVDLSQYWRKVSVEEDGHAVRVQPGITGGMVNARLRKFGKKIGPDPSSIGAAMMGGILSNNSSGMCCGVSQNSYHTLRHARFILPNGKIFSTEQSGEKARFEQECPALCATLIRLRDEVRNNPALHDRIREKYRMKNTVGYSLNALVDHDHPLDILAHLLVGAEGTLAFISEAVLDTVDDPPYKSTSLLCFPDIYSACDAIVPLTQAGAKMIELMDRASLKTVEDNKGMPSGLPSLGEQGAALLVEFQENSISELDRVEAAFLSGTSALGLAFAPQFTRDTVERDSLWKARKGLYPAVGAVRASGTTVLIEDIAFPVPRLADAVHDLHALFKKHGYDQAIIVGHAKDGNLHFMIPQSCNTEADITRYDHFLREMVKLVVHKYDGALKAEHGTGRNMAPFVETEWGGDAYALIKQIKDALDPDHLLNPGVIVNDDPEAHLKHFKLMPVVEEEVDRCVECGFCEAVCPSRNLTATPRRRIVVRRVLQNLKAAGDLATHDALLKEFQYDGLDTCAVDGLCATECPVHINTGDLVKRLRRENHSEADNRRALWVARNFALVEKFVRTALHAGGGLASVFGHGLLNGLTSGLHKVAPALPMWTEQLGAPPSLKVLKQHRALAEKADLVYFPACISRTLGTNAGKADIMTTFLNVCHKAGLKARVLDKVEGSCCGQIFSSKGFGPAYRETAALIMERIWHSTNEGALPLVIDVSSCAYTLHQMRPVLSDQDKQRFDRLRILDSVEFLHEKVLPVLKPTHRKGRVVLHPVCSLKKMGTESRFKAIAEGFAEQVEVPVQSGCCGMAGDRGFLVPELTASASALEAKEVTTAKYEGYYSSTRTCEMAMSHAVKENYESILYLIAETCNA